MTALPPGSTIGILGGGQLGRMLAMAAAELGLRCHIFSDHRGPAFDVAAGTTLGDFTDVEAIRRFAGSVDVVTYEFENVPVDAARAADAIAPVRARAEGIGGRARPSHRKVVHRATRPAGRAVRESSTAATTSTPPC